MKYLNELLFLIIALLVNIIQCISGFAGSILGMPLSIILVGYNVAKPIYNIIGIVASIGVVIALYKHINFKELIKILIILTIGIVIGLIILNNVDVNSKLLLKILGIIIIISTILNIITSLPKFQKFNEMNTPILDFILIVFAGIVQGILVSGGPLLVIYVNKKIKDRDEFRGTISAVWIIVNSIIMTNDIINGSFTIPVLILTLFTIVVLIGSILIGNKLAKKINRELFVKITYVLLFISGISLLLK